jgi:hypothetical protein
MLGLVFLHLLFQEIQVFLLEEPRELLLLLQVR